MSPRRRVRRDRLELLLQTADPVGHAIASEGVEAALDEIGVAITAQPRRRPRLTARRLIRSPRAALLLGVAALAIGGGVAAGSILTAHTGRFPTKPERSMGGPGEYLNPAAPDFRMAAQQVASDIPYPRGYESWRDFLISDWTAEGALISSGALHGWFAASAFCAWVQAWRQARLTGDDDAAARAAKTISAAPGWKAVTDEDPHPASAVRGDLGSTKYTLFGWMLPYRNAVLAGDRRRVEYLLINGYGDKCWSSDPDWRAQEAAHRWRLSSRELQQKYAQYLRSRS